MEKERKPRDHDRWTEARVFGLLKGPFPDGAFVRIPQVRNGTGFSRGRTTTADALIVSCWPSRGLYFAGVEIKVSPSDWKRELGKPAKAAEIQKWCDYWYVAAPAGVIPLGELPPNWGLIECSFQGCKIVKPAPKLNPKPVDVAFVAAVLRAATDSMIPRCEVEALAEQRAQELAQSKTWDAKQLRERVAEFHKQTGVNIHDIWNYGDVSRAIELVKKSKERGVKYMAEHMKEQAERLVRSGCEIMALCDQALADPEGAEIIGEGAVDDA